MNFQKGDTVSINFFDGSKNCFIKNVLELEVRGEKKEMYVLTYRADKFNLVKGESDVSPGTTILTEKINKNF